MQMKIVRVIPVLPKENKKLRVAAYCRVSTSNKPQLRSFMTSKAGCDEAAELSWIKCLERLRKEK